MATTRKYSKLMMSKNPKNAARQELNSSISRELEREANRSMPKKKGGKATRRVSKGRTIYK